MNFLVIVFVVIIKSYCILKSFFCLFQFCFSVTVDWPNGNKKNLQKKIFKNLNEMKWKKGEYSDGNPLHPPPPWWWMSASIFFVSLEFFPPVCFLATKLWKLSGTTKTEKEIFRFFLFQSTNKQTNHWPSTKTHLIAQNETKNKKNWKKTNVTIIINK